MFGYSRFSPKVIPDSIFPSNLYNRLENIVGKYVKYTDGAIATNASYYASGYIAVEGNRAYGQLGASHIAYYDADKVYISGANSVAVTFTTPANAAFIRVSILVANVDLFVVNKEIALPCLVGKEVNIYFDNLFKKDTSDVLVNVVSSANYGLQQNDRWTYTPDASGLDRVIISMHDKATESLLKTNLISMKRAAASAGTGVNKKVLIIGDSTTSAGVYTGELVTLFGDAGEPMDITLIGTKGAGANKHEGISGWTVNQFYTDATSPFVFSGAFDFAQYLSTNTLGTPDVVIFNLGVNDVFYDTSTTLTARITAMKTQIDAMIANIKAVNTNAVIGLCLTIPPSYNQDAFGKSYGVGQTKWQYKINNFMLVKDLITTYAGRTPENIHLVPINLNLDTKNNMQTETVAINSRNATTTTRQSNGVHPAAIGYYQVADCLYYWLKNIA